MTDKEKLALLEEMLELDEGSLNANMELIDVKNWDSMAVITLIALMDERFGKSVSALKIKDFKLVKDILAEME